MAEFSKRWQRSLVAAIGALAYSLVALSCDARDPANSPSVQQLHAVQQQGDAVVDGLLAYKSTVGQFPNKLDDIVPRFLPALTPPLWGSWVYAQLENGSNFVLKFGGDAAPNSGCPEYWTRGDNPKQWFGRS